MALCAAAASAGEAESGCRAESGATTLPLVELYTSEGCNSCPPADRWLAETFAPSGRVQAVALAFHVDYWDRLGWPDRFARAEWSARQEAIARTGGGTVVYTPQVVLQGRDFPTWRSTNAARELARAASRPPRASVDVGARVDGRRVVVAASARVPATADRAGARLVVAYADSGHVTGVKRGENAGVTLTHDHVVRALATSGVADASGALRAEVSFSRPADAGAHPRVVAFVERGDAREILQSVALPLERCGT